MDRKVITQEELIDWMNSKLHKEKDYQDCKFTSVIQLAENDDIGCNWSNPKLNCSGTPGDVCQQAASQIAERARQLFNIS